MLDLDCSLGSGERGALARRAQPTRSSPRTTGARATCSETSWLCSRRRTRSFQRSCCLCRRTTPAGLALVEEAMGAGGVMVVDQGLAGEAGGTEVAEGTGEGVEDTTEGVDTEGSKKGKLLLMKTVSLLAIFGSHFTLLTGPEFGLRVAHDDARRSWIQTQKGQFGAPGLRSVWGAWISCGALHCVRVCSEQQSHTCNSRLALARCRFPRPRHPRGGGLRILPLLFLLSLGPWFPQKGAKLPVTYITI